MGNKPTYEELEQRVRAFEEQSAEHKQTEQALRRERDKLQKYLDVAGAITVVIDFNQKVSLINRRGCEVLGYKANEIKGKNWFDNFLPERVKEHLRSGFIELMAAQQKDINEIFEDGGENPILTKDGKERIIAWRNTVLKDEEGNITATMSSGEDVTEARRAEKALRKSENKYRTLLEQLPQKIFHKDRNSVYVSCNEYYARDLGIKPEEIKGRTEHDFFPKKLARKYRADDKKVMASGKTKEFDEKYILDGQEIFVHTVKTPVKDEKGRITGVLGIFWDVTEKKQDEETLREREAALNVRTRELEEVNKALRVLMTRMKEEKQKLEENVSSNVKELVAPYAKKLRNSRLGAKQKAYLKTLESNLNDITSPFARKFSSKYFRLTPSEIQIAHLVKDGQKTKQIANLLNLSLRTIESHRRNIRMKIGVKNKQANLRSVLLSMEDD